MNEPPVRSENPFASPTAEMVLQAEAVPSANAGLWREGNKLVVLKRAQLPPICVKSGEPAEDWMLRNFVWCPPLAYISLLAGLIPAIIVILILQKKGALYVPVTREVRRQRRNKILIAWGLGLLSIVSLVGGIAIAASDESLAGVFLVGLLAFFGFLIAAVAVGSAATAIIKPTRITEHYMWFKGVHPAIIDQLPHWEPGSERRPYIPART